MRRRAMMMTMMMVVGLLVSAQFAAAGHTPNSEPYAPTKRSGATINVPPTPGSPGGVIKGELISSVNQCYFKGPPGSQVWTCQVSFMLTLQVPPFTCGEAYSPAAPGYPTERIYACGTVDPLGTYTTATHEFQWELPEANYSHRSIGGNEVCKSVTGPCMPWAHSYQIPAPQVYQTSADVNVIAGIVYDILWTIVNLLPRETRVGTGVADDVLLRPEAEAGNGALAMGGGPG